MEADNQLPDGWIKISIGEVCNDVERANPVEIFDEDFDYIDIGSIDNSLLRIVEPKKISPSDASSRARQIVRAGDTLLSTTRVYLKNIAIVPKELDGQIASTAFCVLRANPKLMLPQLLNIFVTNQSFINKLTTLQRGNSPPAVLEDDVKAQPIPIAPLPEQQRIVDKIEELFSALDDGEANLQKVQTLLARYRQSVLRDAVTGELTKEWREANQHRLESGQDLLERILKTRREQWQGRGKYKEPQVPDTTDLPELPEGWVWCTLDQLLIGIEAGKNIRCQEIPPVDDQVGVVKISAVTWGEFNEEESKTITNTESVNYLYRIHSGDLLISRANTLELVGATVVVKNIAKNLLLSDKVLRLRLADDALKHWINLYLKSRQGRDQIESLATGNQLSMRNITQLNMRKIVIPLPPKTEVEYLCTRFDEEKTRIDASIRACNNELTRSSSLRQSVLKDAFSGKLLAQDPNDEPASELLKRIQAEREAEAAKTKKPTKRKTKTKKMQETA